MRWFVFVFFLLCQVTGQATCTVTDDDGKSLTFSHPAKRIISLAPDITEILFAIGAEKQIVGVIAGSDYPPRATLLPIVGSYAGIDVEKILSLHPDLIVTWRGGFARSLQTLKSFHLPIYVHDPHRLEEVMTSMRNLGCLTGQSSVAQTMAAHYAQQLTKLRQQYAHRPSVKIFFQIGSYSLITINRHSWINQAITLCGGKNVFAHATFPAPEVTWEAVLAANPQAVISDATTATWRQPWLRWPQLAAVQRHALYSIEADLIERAGPRLLEGVGELCREIERGRSHDSS